MLVLIVIVIVIVCALRRRRGGVGAIKQTDNKDSSKIFKMHFFEIINFIDQRPYSCRRTEHSLSTNANVGKAKQQHLQQRRPCVGQNQVEQRVQRGCGATSVRPVATQGA